MSVQEFFRQNPAGPELATAMRYKQQIAQGEGHPRSAVNVLARTIIDVGGAGLRQALRRFSDSGLALSPTSEDLRRIPLEERMKILINNAAIVFGVTIVGIETVLINKHVDSEELCALYNGAVSGTRFPTWKVREPHTTVVSDQEWRKMIEHANRDKTLAIFFEEGSVGVLPRNLRELLGASEAIPYIRGDLLPAYRERAHFLIPAQG